MSSEIVASYTFVIVKGGTYRKTFTFTDESGAPIEFTSLQIDITPNIGDAFSWTQGNGLFTLQSAGVYLLELSDTYTAAIEATSGTYRFNGVEAASGDVNPCFLEGLAFFKDC
jgi:hypothetical protein